MKKIIHIKKLIILILTGFLFFSQSCTNHKKTIDITSTVANFKTVADSIGYCFGTQNANFYKDFNFNEYITVESILLGFRDRLRKKNIKINPDSIQAIIDRFMAEMDTIRHIREDEEIRKRRMREREFLEKNKHAPGVITTASGLQYKIIREGKGTVPALTDSVQISYRGTAVDSSITFYSSEYPPTIVKISQTIKAWAEILPQMNVGSTYKLYLAPELAWGDSGDGGDVDPDQVVIYELTLRDILK